MYFVPPHLFAYNAHMTIILCRCFLLTPKLLPDLQYSEACSILNVMNGPWIEEPSKGNFLYRKLHLSSLLLLILLTIFSANQSGLLVIGGVLSLGMLERPDVKV
jgi:hypothetical protein